ncbi:MULTISPECIES: DUF4177 domain-containing protein [Paenibacillus]|jgi:hypothetical protein|uniref:DUF4177 domain-containing protein n=1 Tax=Paenibacillus TaxID=44249 RepID=UPI0004F8BFDD|nr:MULTISPECIES: DUF4177 domain-containing protein [unclassified Paenibacillus]AIQ27084.1 hypothetical protein P40081_01895 [Paenibacillus sp. FSL P4-0081]OMF29604.1 hypothetical protein BK132_11175 [Paenibacillus sp. FSL H8-0259]
MDKYEYNYVSISVGIMSGKVKEDFKVVIDRYAADGWKLHSIVPMPLLAGGQASTLELIFERIKE